MKTIKYFWLLLLFIGLANTAKAQSSATIEATQLYTSFKFSDSQGSTLNSEYSGIFTSGYGVGYRYIAQKGLMFSAKIGFHKAGATLDYDNMNYKWNLQYTDVRLGGGYMLQKGRISPYLNVSGYYSYLLSGFQTINNEEFNIKKSKSLYEMDYGVLITPGIQIILSETFSSYVEFNYSMGFQNLEKNQGQKSTNLGYGLTLGLSLLFGR